MASLRDIRDRITSVKNTQQITRAMKMVAAAKLRRAQERIFETRPYSYKIREVLEHLRAQVDPSSHPFFVAPPATKAVLLIVVTSDRGLAGAFNTNILKTAEARIAEAYADLQDQGSVHIMGVGRKAHEYFAKRGYPMEGDYQNVFGDLTFDTVLSAMDRAVSGWTSGRWDRVEVIYNEFKNTISQNKIVETLLPVPAETFATPVMEADESYGEFTPSGDQEYIFEPNPRAILDRLVPQFLNYQLWRAMLESNAAEQGARMVAMDNATTNAGELLKDLKLTYNRARQAAITTEIIEISSGAEALSAG